VEVPRFVCNWTEVLPRDESAARYGTSRLTEVPQVRFRPRRGAVPRGPVTGRSPYGVCWLSACQRVGFDFEKGELGWSY